MALKIRSKRSRSSSRMLITVNVSGSPGPIRLLVNTDDSVAGVIRSVLKEYARQRRHPVLGKHPGDFDLCCAIADGTLSACAAIGSSDCRSFSMFKRAVDGGLSSCKKQPADRFRSLLHKSLNLITITSH